MAGWLSARRRGITRALQIATAAGAASTTRLGGGQIDSDKDMRLADDIRVTASPR
jgi:hypothetical protein